MSSPFLKLPGGTSQTQYTLGTSQVANVRLELRNRIYELVAGTDGPPIKLKQDEYTAISREHDTCHIHIGLFAGIARVCSQVRKECLLSKSRTRNDLPCS